MSIALLEARAPLRELLRRAREYDNELNYREVCPTGDDYNAIIGLIRTAALQAGFAYDDTPGLPFNGHKVPAEVAARLERIETKLWPNERKR